MRQPLSFQAFIDPNFYSKRAQNRGSDASDPSRNDHEYYLPALQEEDFQSIETII